MTGEFEKIDRFLQAFRAAGGRTEGGAVLLGPGDDCALVRSGRPLAVTTDAVVDGVHFRLDRATPRQVGHKALAVNLSDLAGMGARPAAFTCALTVPRGFDDAHLDGIAAGMGSLAARFGCVLAGGNFSGGRELAITITALGEVEGTALRRDAARPGDPVVLVGALGEAAAELAWLEAGRALPPGRSAQHEPEPLVEAGLRAAMTARCGIDVSDGLVQDLGHVAKASGVRVVVELDRVPRSDRFRALASGFSEAQAACWLRAGGEDYALVVTGAAEGVVIGRVEAGAGVVVEGQPAGLALEGFDHFR
jgi:thiamine-monophosphate kinase